MKAAAGGKQKPNEACGCGSGAKFKKCCGGAGASAAAAHERAAPQPAGAAAAAAAAAPPREQHHHPSPEALNRTFAEAGEAVEAGEWARALRRVAAVLSPAGVALAAAHTHHAGERAPWSVAQMAEVARVVVRCLNYACTAQSQPGRPLLGDACDAHARALAILTPPHTFWARALTCLTHAAWRDAPLDAADERVTLPPAVTGPLCCKLLSATHECMAEGYGRLHGHAADAIAAYERAVAALALERPGAARDYRESNHLQSIGHLHRGAGRTAAARAAFTRALALVRRLRDDEPEEQALSIAHLQSCLAMLDVELDLESDDKQYQMYADAWGAPRDGYSAEKVAVTLCSVVLGSTRSAARQRPSLLRAVTLPGAADAARGAAARACRACGAAAPAAAEQKLKRCAGCGRVAFCSAACQAADWRRHKRFCTGGMLADSAEAALADATCAVCCRALVPDDAAAADDAHEGAAREASAYQAVVMPRCMHLLHAACMQERGCVACA
jgi:hypothetical protein